MSDGRYSFKPVAKPPSVHSLWRLSNNKNFVELEKGLLPPKPIKTTFTALISSSLQTSKSIEKRTLSTPSQKGSNLIYRRQQDVTPSPRIVSVSLSNTGMLDN